MPLALIQIEQIERNRWQAEIEAGGLPGNPYPFRRAGVAANSFPELLSAVAERYFAQVPGDKPVDPVVATAEFEEPPAVPEAEPVDAKSKAAKAP